MGDKGPVYPRRIERLRERAKVLRARAAEESGGRGARFIAEAVAIDWVIAELEATRLVLLAALSAAREVDPTGCAFWPGPCEHRPSCDWRQKAAALLDEEKRS